eukprot:TRINITY_DN53040_c0_g1_i1.p1 TRINITY_DN53040_c0_g1~~TRINITY_DN53040_c0_g1_i1.p1  ORF type:complete len:109 (+),score=5.65 TRINITY_DN53040_c0_g1_i1:2-328(+)
MAHLARDALAEKTCYAIKSTLQCQSPSQNLVDTRRCTMAKRLVKMWQAVSTRFEGRWLTDDMPKASSQFVWNKLVHCRPSLFDELRPGTQTILHSCAGIAQFNDRLVS